MNTTMMLNTTTPGEASDLQVIQDGPVLRLTLNRPDKRNALSRTLIADLTHALTGVQAGGTIRVVVLAGNGNVFCAGGDIKEFAAAARSGLAEAEAEGLADLFDAITTCPVPIIARVHGSAFGGGVGLVSACDIAIADSGTRFALSEARLGLVAAVISRYVIAALGWRAARAHMMRGASFDAVEALRCGLVHEVTATDDLDQAVEQAVADVLKCAPGALATAKRLPESIDGPEPASRREATIRILAKCLDSEETQEGLNAFLEKRAPAWVTEPGDR